MTLGTSMCMTAKCPPRQHMQLTAECRWPTPHLSTALPGPGHASAQPHGSACIVQRTGAQQTILLMNLNYMPKRRFTCHHHCRRLQGDGGQRDGGDHVVQRAACIANGDLTDPKP